MRVSHRAVFEEGCALGAGYVRREEVNEVMHASHCAVGASCNCFLVDYINQSDRHFEIRSKGLVATTSLPWVSYTCESHKSEVPWGCC